MTEKPEAPPAKPRRVVGRYAVFDVVGAGGMGSVHLARLIGPAGFSRIVAIKRVHAHRAEDPFFVEMLIDEARLSSRVRHPNVVPTLDVVVEDDEVLLVMEYVAGESLHRLMSEAVEREQAVPVPVAVGIAVDVLDGLQAAHEATDEQGELLHLVHRDVSPQNVLVGADGLARLLDFGVAKARGRLQTTRDGGIKGKLSYMAPEQLQGNVVPQSDVFAAATLLWEMLAGRRLFDAESEGAMLFQLMSAPIPSVAELRSDVPASLGDVVEQGLARALAERFCSASEMAKALAEAAPVASKQAVAAWVRDLASDRLATRSAQVLSIETVPSDVLVRASQDRVSSPAQDVLPRGDGGEATTDAYGVPSSPPSIPTGLGGQVLSHAKAPRRSWVLALAVTTTLLVAGLAGLWWAASEPSEPEPRAFGAGSPGATQTASASVEPIGSAEPAVASATPDAATSAAPSATKPTVVEPSAPKVAFTTSATAAASAAPAETIAAPPATSPPPPPTTPTTPKVRPGCEQPSYIDENGITRYKVECL